MPWAETPATPRAHFYITMTAPSSGAVCHLQAMICLFFPDCSAISTLDLSLSASSDLLGDVVGLGT